MCGVNTDVCAVLVSCKTHISGVSTWKLGKQSGESAGASQVKLNWQRKFYTGKVELKACRRRACRSSLHSGERDWAESNSGDTER